MLDRNSFVKCYFLFPLFPWSFIWLRLFYVWLARLNVAIFWRNRDGQDAHTGRRIWCQICQREWLHPSVASWPNNQPQVSSPVGTVGSGQTGVWWGASPAFSSQLMPSPSVLRTCQWETVLTHQIMAERKLLQGGDILRWKYGDVKCALGGEEEGGSVPWKGTNYSSIDMRKYRVGMNILTHVHFPLAHTHKRGNLPCFEGCGCPNRIKFLLLTCCRNKEVFQVLRVKRVTHEKSKRRGRVVFCWCFQLFVSVIKTNYTAPSLKQVGGELKWEGPESSNGLWELPPVDGTLTPGYDEILYGQHPIFESTALNSRIGFALFSMMTLESLYSVNRGEAGGFFCMAPCGCSIPVCAYGQSLFNNCLGIIKCSHHPTPPPNAPSQ